MCEKPGFVKCKMNLRTGGIECVLPQGPTTLILLKIRQDIYLFSNCGLHLKSTALNFAFRKTKTLQPYSLKYPNAYNRTLLTLGLAEYLPYSIDFAYVFQ